MDEGKFLNEQLQWRCCHSSDRDLRPCSSWSFLFNETGMKDRVYTHTLEMSVLNLEI